MAQTEPKATTMSLRQMADVLLSPGGDRCLHMGLREGGDMLGTQTQPRVSPGKEETRPVEGQRQFMVTPVSLRDMLGTGTELRDTERLRCPQRWPRAIRKAPVMGGDVSPGSR